MIPVTIQVALGGALGAAARYIVGAQLMRPGFPVAVLAVNVVGSFLMGLLVVWLGRRGLTEWQPFLLTGLLGGFTTFSAFSLETVTLFERGEVAQAAGYVAASVGLSVGALALGVWMMRGLT
ncbi:fluoride efflux transporter CrcB [uncultured Jannaschia sp.]|uniref:fluoride efflux transporter CrcB n=1 Tax=uncultured Jannaschia sp. TaxID=293347 RepID=UPI00261E8CF9|nr:fluoride efflux transporter CrcB [uncultured Jannaschia sp.]